ncbi:MULTISPECIES: beta-glucosidase BglX [Acidobacteriaceae]|uniref:beta-glucosidase BglX n=1 Tax=Acidobacteriaceae TaxID=204434 RepID=UPI00131AA8EE|nr:MULTISPECIES: beta-glucosidase BglX [Acidobacteriaceae]MDW5264424.1 beta-glucosidase BglX [Edaphobacter sp.]
MTCRFASRVFIHRFAVGGLSLALLGGVCPHSLLAQVRPASQNHRIQSAGDTQSARFVNDLLRKMTLEEKIGQMSQIALNQPQDVSPDQRILDGQVSSFLFLTDANEINRLQHIAVDRTRLHIPLIFGFDVVHGFRTIYPVPLALAASWDPDLVEHVQSMAAKEASAVGVNWTFAPMVDIARDPRWGRIMEGAGEDPYLGSKMAAAQVRGFQGDRLGSPNHILACVKHFAGYGAAVGGRDYDSSDISDEQLWNVYFPPFEAAVRAGSGSLMPAYMDLNGVPAAGNKFLLQDVLRDKWKFDGFVVSDWDAVTNLTTHGFASGPEDAAARAVNAGVDMEMTSHVYRDNLAAAVKDGLVKESTINESVRRILTTKYRLGLFSHPYADPSKASAQLVSPEQRHAARVAAERTAVLLRNEGHLLPLSKSLKSIAVIGPLADSKPDIMGSWSLAGHPADAVTVLEGIRQRLGADATVSSTKGVEIARGQPSIFDSQFPSPPPTLKTDAERDTEFAHAIDLVKKSQVTVLVLGEAQNMSGERASRSTLTLPGRQQQFLEAAVATGKPIILVLLNGRPLNITWASQHVPAILDAWYPGTEGGNAIADLLFGDANPGGKLPVSWPRSVGQVPIFYARNLTQIPHDPDTRYWDGSSAPLYPFGYGLSYTSFKLDGLKLASSSVKSGSSLAVSVDVQNTGSVAGDEVVQLYTHQRSGSASRPVRELKGFRRITLKPGETQTVTLQLDTRDLGFWSSQTHHWAIEPGIFDLWIGTSSAATDHATFTVLSQ